MGSLSVNLDFISTQWKIKRHVGSSIKVELRILKEMETQQQVTVTFQITDDEVEELTRALGLV